jgi:hypothetical protein
MASASTSDRSTKPWEHNQASSILDGMDSSAKLLKAQVVLHVKELACLIEQLDGLVNPNRSPSPCETLIRCWNEALVALSVEGNLEELLPADELQGVLEKFRVKREEMMKTITQLQGCAPAAPSGPGSAQHAFAATNPDKNGKSPMDEAPGEDFLAMFRSDLGKRSQADIEDAQSKAPPLRTSTVPCKMPMMPGKY